jgi:hypothetical protein
MPDARLGHYLMTRIRSSLQLFSCISARTDTEHIQVVLSQPRPRASESIERGLSVVLIEYGMDVLPGRATTFTYYSESASTC